MKVLFYTRSVLLKKLAIGYIPSGGRNSQGKICVRHRGGGEKRKIYLIDYYRRINNFG